jgi:hypothetical protein
MVAVRSSVSARMYVRIHTYTYYTYTPAAHAQPLRRLLLQLLQTQLHNTAT